MTGLGTGTGDSVSPRGARGSMLTGFWKRSHTPKRDSLAEIASCPSGPRNSGCHSATSPRTYWVYQGWQSRKTGRTRVPDDIAKQLANSRTCSTLKLWHSITVLPLAIRGWDFYNLQLKAPDGCIIWARAWVRQACPWPWPWMSLGSQILIPARKRWHPLWWRPNSLALQTLTARRQPLSPAIPPFACFLEPSPPAARKRNYSLNLLVFSTIVLTAWNFQPPSPTTYTPLPFFARVIPQT